MGVFKQSLTSARRLPWWVLDQADQGAMDGLIRHLHELVLPQVTLDESTLILALCRTSCCRVPSLFACVAKAFSFLGVLIQGMNKCLWTGFFLANSSYRANVRSQR